MDENNPITHGVISSTIVALESDVLAQEREEKNRMEEIRNLNLELYESLLEKAAYKGSSVVFPNSGKDHAAVAMSVLFNNTSKTMKLIVSDFNGSVSNNPRYVEALQNCLDNNAVKVQIITLETPYMSDGHKVFIAYNEKHPGRVTIKKASETTKNLLKNHINKDVSLGVLFNLGLFDDNKYRLEILPSKYTALISFNNREKVTKYGQIFDEAFATAGVQ
jgi:hypothetical protein